MRKIVILLLLLCLLTALLPAAHGYTSRVVDDAALLTADEHRQLTEIADQLSEKHNADIVIVTVDSLGHKSAEAFADDYFDDNGYGIGSNRSGILLLLSMEYRDWAISTSGNCIRVFSDRKIDSIFNTTRPLLSSGDYFSAFSLYLRQLDKHFDGHTSDNQTDFGDIALRFLISLAIGAAAGGITLAVMRSKMNTARPQYGATDYIVKNSYHLHKQLDLYLYSKTTRTRKEHNSSGSSTHRSSSGRSHGGRSGKF